VEDCGLSLSSVGNLPSRCRFPPLVLSRSGSFNVDYLFEYSEVSGLQYACPSRAGIIQQVLPVGVSALSALQLPANNIGG